LDWYRELIAKRFDGSRFRKSVDEEIERLGVRMAKENPSWGYERMVGAMANLGHKVSDQTVGNILRRHDIPPAPKRKQTAVGLTRCAVLMRCRFTDRKVNGESGSFAWHAMDFDFALVVLYDAVHAR
jgi:hypothetical protein